MSFQSDASKTPSDEWKVRAALKPKENYDVSDFPVGRMIVGETFPSYRSARVGYALCEVIDCYSRKSLRYSSGGLAIHGRVLATADDYLEPLVGHVVQLGLAARGRWHSESGLRVTTIPPKQMFASADTHPPGGDSTEIEAPASLSGAVPEGQTPVSSPSSSPAAGR